MTAQNSLSLDLCAQIASQAAQCEIKRSFLDCVRSLANELSSEFDEKYPNSEDPTTLV